MMKWRVQRNIQCNSIEQEDVRHSLEILDSVLAEFDDCIDSWDSPAICKKEFSLYDSRPDIKWDGAYTELRHKTGVKFSLAKLSIDGSTNDESRFQAEQAKIVSPPPIPKRSPFTRLSEPNLSVFTFSSDNTSLSSSDSSPYDCDGLSSNHFAITRVLSENNGCDENSSKISKTCCAKCGKGLRSNGKMDNSKEIKNDDLSPFLQKKKMFEERITTSASSSPGVTRVNHKQSYRLKKNASADLLTTETPSMHSSADKPSVEVTKVRKPIRNDRETKHDPNCKCQEKLEGLRTKFADVLTRLRNNEIKLLDTAPPDFVPEFNFPNATTRQDASRSDNHCTTPKTDVQGESLQISEVQTDNENIDLVDEHNDTFETESDNSILNEDTGSVHSLDPDSLNEVPTKRHSLSSTSELPNLCNKCSSSLSMNLSQTIEDIPHLLPTDVLNRPQFGLSYSLEDDLSPGVKEILKNSTLKRDVTSSPSPLRTKESNLSTFSHSASSLGYVSSQSDLELNDVTPDKVPLSSFKSVTLPHGLELSPFYSASDEDYSKSFNKDYSSSNDDSLLSKNSDLVSRDFPSSPPADAHKRKKSLFGFSRKGKKDKHKQGATLETS